MRAVPASAARNLRVVLKPKARAASPQTMIKITATPTPIHSLLFVDVRRHASAAARRAAYARRVKIRQMPEAGKRGNLSANTAAGGETGTRQIRPRQTRPGQIRPRPE